MLGTLGTHTILVCEDDPSVAALFADILDLPGRRIVRAQDGAAALQMAHELHPSAIILDLDLPCLDGGLVLTRLKADPRTAMIPVVIVSANIGWLTFLDRREASSVLEKPCSPADLEAAIGEALGAGERRRPTR